MNAQQFALFDLPPVETVPRAMFTCTRVTRHPSKRARTFTRPLTGGTVQPCPECNASTTGNTIVGKRTGSKCDPRCTGAAGFDCECSCGGTNHGSDWS